jgi:SPP1 family predicted phage head-tail adaptor
VSFTSLLIHRCNIKRYTVTGTDAYGQPVKDWADIYTNEPCRLASPSGKEIKKDLEVVISDFKLFIRAEVDVTERDRVEVNGSTYEILLVQERAAMAVHHKELSLQRVS